jgi:hypothetical protein
MGFSATPAAPWSCDTLEVTTRGHTKATECLWFNFPRPTVIHDTRRVGDNHRERWRIEKRRRNWKKHFEAMPLMERESIFAVLADVRAASNSAAAGVTVLNAKAGVAGPANERGR